MKGIVHFHRKHVCIVAQQTMAHKTAQDSWEISNKKGTRTT
jgi:hypothetical protein